MGSRRYNAKLRDCKTFFYCPAPRERQGEGKLVQPLMDQLKRFTPTALTPTLSRKRERGNSTAGEETAYG
jgi:hypothetical protein